MSRLRLTIGVKVAVAFMVLFLTVGVLGGVAINGVADLNAAAADIRNSWLPSTQVNGRLIAAVKEHRLATSRNLIATTADAQTGAEDRLLKAADEVAKARAAYEPFIVKGTDDETLIRQFDQAWADYQPSVEKVLDAKARGNRHGRSLRAYPSRWTAGCQTIEKTDSSKRYGLVGYALSPKAFDPCPLVVPGSC